MNKTKIYNTRDINILKNLQNAFNNYNKFKNKMQLKLIKINS
jgi:hypothetical protein